MIAFLNNIIFNSHIPCIIIITLSNKTEQEYKSTLHYNCQPDKIKNIQHQLDITLNDIVWFLQYKPCKNHKIIIKIQPHTQAYLSVIDNDYYIKKYPKLSIPFCNNSISDCQTCAQLLANDIKEYIEKCCIDTTINIKFSIDIMFKTVSKIRFFDDKLYSDTSIDESLHQLFVKIRRISIPTVMS